MPITHLDDRAVLQISGPEARDFLQGLITNDIGQLSSDRPLYAALLTPQGKILFDFLLFADADSILIDCWAPASEALRKRLSMYRLRAKVEIAMRDDLVVVAAWGDGKLPGHAANDPRLTALGWRAVLPRAAHPEASGMPAYVAHRLHLGVPEAADFGQDKIFALDAGLDELHAIDFTKGCYVGQELTARMKHRGTARKRILSVAGLNAAVLPPADTSITSNGRDLGTLISIYGAHGFGLIRLDRLEEAAGAPIEVGGVAAIVTKPMWLFA